MGTVLVYLNHVNLFIHECRQRGLTWQRMGSLRLKVSDHSTEMVLMVQYGFATIDSMYAAREIVDKHGIGV